MKSETVTSIRIDGAKKDLEEFEARFKNAQLMNRKETEELPFPPDNDLDYIFKQLGLERTRYKSKGWLLSYFNDETAIYLQFECSEGECMEPIAWFVNEFFEDRLKVTFWAENITDEVYKTNVNSEIYFLEEDASQHTSASFDACLSIVEKVCSKQNVDFPEIKTPAELEEFVHYLNFQPYVLDFHIYKHVELKDYLKEITGYVKGETVKPIKFEKDNYKTWRIGTKVVYESHDFDETIPQRHYGTVKEIYSDHIIVDVPDISDHMWCDDDFAENYTAISAPVKTFKADFDNLTLTDTESGQSFSMSDLIKIKNEYEALKIYEFIEENYSDEFTKEEIIDMAYYIAERKQEALKNQELFVEGQIADEVIENFVEENFPRIQKRMGIYDVSRKKNTGRKM